MPPTITLPRRDGTLAPYTLSGRAPVTAPPGPITSRIGMAAVHVVADPLANVNPTLDVALDWDATLRFRHHVWSLGLAVAEAMDTAQRGMGFEWASAKELIKRSVAESKTVPGAVLASGAGTDHLEPGPRVRAGAPRPGGGPMAGGPRFPPPGRARGRRPPPLRRAAGDLRRHRPGGLGGPEGARPRRPCHLRAGAGAHAHALAPRLRRSHALLQDRRRLRRLPQRPPVALPHGGRDGERAPGRAPGRAVPPDGRRRPAEGSRGRRRAHAPRAGGRRPRLTAQRMSPTTRTRTRSELPGR